MSAHLLILGDQLFSPTLFRHHGLPPRAIIIEDHGLCTHYKYHKQKLILFLAAMRAYRDELEQAGITVCYKELPPAPGLSYEEVLLECIKPLNVSELVCFEIEDAFMAKRIERFCAEHHILLTIKQSPMFLTSRAQFAEYLGRVKTPFMKNFYEQRRRDLGVLMEGAAPLGGKFSFDAENRKPLPKSITPPVITGAPIDRNPHLKEVTLLVERVFPDHPGESAHFWFPTTRSGATQWLSTFLETRLHNFGEYEDAITERSDTVYHSILTPLLNTGLITPAEVLSSTLAFAGQNDVPLNSLEGFIRQLIGWREFVRGIYHNYGETQARSNFWNHTRTLTPHWYNGTTGIPPLDRVIAKTLRLAYCHHIERLMIASNLMLLSEIHPAEVYRWFMEMFIDSADWVMTPNVYGMGQFSDGGIFATKPYICGSNYILKMSDTATKQRAKGPGRVHSAEDDWCDTVDGLYWAFIEKHKEFYASNNRTRMMVSLVDKIPAERKTRIYSKAEQFKALVTA